MQRSCDSESGQPDCQHGLLWNLLQWLATPPMFTLLRVNTINTTVEAAKELVKKELQQVVCCVCVCVYTGVCDCVYTGVCVGVYECMLCCECSFLFIFLCLWRVYGWGLGVAICL